MSGDAHGAGAAFTVDVIAGDRGVQRVVAVRVTPGDTVSMAWQRSGLAAAQPPGAPPELAVFGARVPPDRPLRPGDRVEVLRPLEVDPREARRRRAALRGAKRRAPRGRGHSAAG